MVFSHVVVQHLKHLVGRIEINCSWRLPLVKSIQSVVDNFAMLNFEKMFSVLSSSVADGSTKAFTDSTFGNAMC